MPKNTVLYWSGGKDSAMALYEIGTNQRYGGLRVVSLLTTLTEGYNRISGHGVRRSLLERQIACLGLSLHKTYIPKKCTMSEYESVMEQALSQHVSEGIGYAATGDIFLKKRRMGMFRKTRMRGCFPLLQKSTRENIRIIISLGFKAYVVCVDSAVLDGSFTGDLVDEDFLDRLPAGVDPCGENGEFHTFVFDGPIFRERVECVRGEVVLREGFYFCDLVPVG